MRTMDNALMTLEALRSGYAGEEKLHGVTAAFRAGQLTVVIGPNGSGKSTLLKCMAGQLPVTEGRIGLEGRPIDTFGRLERARMISYMPQSRLIPETSVGQLVMHGRYPHLKWGQRPGAEDRRVVREALERVGLSARASRPAHQLSGGERQRAYVAMMLAQQARGMLLDEPTVYLDPSGQFELMNLLRELSASGACVVAVLHDLSLAMRYADRILLMNQGQLVQQGTPAEVYASKQLERCFGIRIRRLGEHYVFLSAADG